MYHKLTKSFIEATFKLLVCDLILQMWRRLEKIGLCETMAVVWCRIYKENQLQSSYVQLNVLKIAKQNIKSGSESTWENLTQKDLMDFAGDS